MRQINIAFRTDRLQLLPSLSQMGWSERIKLALTFLCLRLIQPFRGGSSAAEIESAKRRIALHHGIKEEEVMDYLAEEARKRHG